MQNVPVVNFTIQYCRSLAWTIVHFSRPLFEIDFHSANATTLAPNHYNMVNATQGNSCNASNECNKQTNATNKQTLISRLIFPCQYWSGKRARDWWGRLSQPHFLDLLCRQDRPQHLHERLLQHISRLPLPFLWFLLRFTSARTLQLLQKPKKKALHILQSCFLVRF